MLLATGFVAYFVISAINEVSLSMLGGQDVDLRVDSVAATWSLPVMAILGRYLLSVIVDSSRRKRKEGGAVSSGESSSQMWIPSNTQDTLPK